MKNAILYLFLVGGSVVCVIGLLILGEDAKAPFAVGGTWAIETATPDAGIPSCADLPIAAENPSFKISQSGPHLELQFNDKRKTDLTGVIDGSAVTAGTERSRRSSGSVRLEGTVERRPEADRFTGALIVANCSQRVPLVASRQKAAAKVTGGH